MVVTGNNPARIQWLVTHFGNEFAIKDLRFLHHFLGIEVRHFNHGLFLCQTRYAKDFLSRAHLEGCKALATPTAFLSRKLSTNDELFLDPTHYRSIVSALQYPTFTRPDISYNVNFVCQFMHSFTMAHFKLVKRILRYISGTTHFGMRILSSSSFNLYAFLDAEWAGCPATRRSTMRFYTFLRSNCISWSAKKQAIVARSSVEAEYRSMASATAELTRLSFLLHDIGLPLPKQSTPFFVTILVPFI